VATSRKRSTHNPEEQAKTVATGCNQLPIAAHGKGGGFESEEGLQERRTSRVFRSEDGVGGGETRRDLVVAGRAQHTRRAQVIDAFASEGLGELDLHLG
jgi:hypothetical protein